MVLCHGLTCAGGETRLAVSHCYQSIYTPRTSACIRKQPIRCGRGEMLKVASFGHVTKGGVAFGLRLFTKIRNYVLSTRTIFQHLLVCDQAGLLFAPVKIEKHWGLTISA